MNARYKAYGQISPKCQWHSYPNYVIYLGKTAAIVGALALSLTAAHGSSSAATAPETVRLAGPSDCMDNASCGRGLLRVYHVNVSTVLTKLLDADGGVDALDDGSAEVAIVFSSHPLAGRRDLLKLRDDRGMIGPENLVPTLRSATLGEFRKNGPAVRARIALVSRELSLRDLRAMEQLTMEGRLPEPIAGEWVESHGLAERGVRRRGGPRIVLGYMAFHQAEITARIYAQALVGAGFRAIVRPVNGLRAALFTAYTRGVINGSVGYATSTLRFLRRDSTTTAGVDMKRRLRAALALRGLTPLTYARAANANTFVMRRSVAARLHVRTLSDLRRYWPAG